MILSFDIYKNIMVDLGTRLLGATCCMDEQPCMKTCLSPSEVFVNNFVQIS